MGLVQERWTHREDIGQPEVLLAHRTVVARLSKDKTAASMQRMADVMAKEKAELWINHDKAQRDGQRMSPEYYE